MQTACCINQHNICTVGLSTLQRVESHRGRVAAHLLLHHRNANALAPDAELFDSSGTEGVGSTKIDILASLLKLPGQFANRRGLTHSIHAYHQDDVGLVVARQIPVIIVVGIIL